MTLTSIVIIIATAISALGIRLFLARRLSFVASDSAQYLAAVDHYLSTGRMELNTVNYPLQREHPWPNMEYEGFIKFVSLVKRLGVKNTLPACQTVLISSFLLFWLICVFLALLLLHGSTADYRILGIHLPIFAASTAVILAFHPKYLTVSVLPFTEMPHCALLALSLLTVYLLPGSPLLLGLILGLISGLSARIKLINIYLFVSSVAFLTVKACFSIDYVPALFIAALSFLVSMADFIVGDVRHVRHPIFFWRLEHFSLVAEKRRQRSGHPEKISDSLRRYITSVNIRILRRDGRGQKVFNLTEIGPVRASKISLYNLFSIFNPAHPYSIRHSLGWFYPLGVIGFIQLTIDSGGLFYIPSVYGFMLVNTAVLILLFAFHGRIKHLGGRYGLLIFPAFLFFSLNLFARFPVLTILVVPIIVYYLYRSVLHMTGDRLIEHLISDQEYTPPTWLVPVANHIEKTMTSNDLLICRDYTTWFGWKTGINTVLFYDFYWRSETDFWNYLATFFNSDAYDNIYLLTNAGARADLLCRFNEDNIKFSSTSFRKRFNPKEKLRLGDDLIMIFQAVKKDIDRSDRETVFEAWTAEAETAARKNNRLLSPEGEDHLRNLISSWQRERKKVVIYGVGRHTEILMEEFPELTDIVIAFTDRNLDRRAGRFYDKPVVFPKKLADLGADGLLISSRTFQEEIYKFLVKSAPDGIEIHRLYDKQERDKSTQPARSFADKIFWG
ncbi:hypothetical protein ACFLT7_02605 [candidate division KSB1 bacterium]